MIKLIISIGISITFSFALWYADTLYRISINPFGHIKTIWIDDAFYGQSDNYIITVSRELGNKIIID